MPNNALSLTLGFPPMQSLPTPDFWLDASDSSTITQSSGVSGWTDKINSISAAQADSTKQPLLISNAINGLPTIRFDGGNDFLRTPDMSLSWDGGDKTLVFVAKYSTSNYYGLFDSAPSNASVIRNYPSDRLDWHDGNPSLTISPVSNNFAIYFFEYWYSSNRNIGKFVNGGNYGTASGTNSSTLRWNTFTLGIINGSENPFSGDISEVILYKRKLASDDRDSLHSYLSNKWGIALA